MKANWKRLFLPVVILSTLYFLYEPDLKVEDLKEVYTNDLSTLDSINGQFTHYQIWGAENTETVVLLHGTGASLHTWYQWAEELSKDYKVVLMDLPGFGLTGPHKYNNYKPEDYTNFIGDFLDHLSLDSCHIGGNSLGGFIAWNAAVAFPIKFKSLLLIDAAGFETKAKSVPLAFKLAKIPVLGEALTKFSPKGIVASSVRNVYANPSLVTNELIDRYFNLSKREGNRAAFIQRLNEEKREIKVDDLTLIKVPTFIMWGGKDNLIPVENAQYFSNAIANDTLVIFPNLGHVPMEEDATSTVTAYREFLNGID